MLLQRQYFLLSYFKTLSVGSGRSRTHDNPMLNQRWLRYYIISTMFSKYLNCNLAVKLSQFAFVQGDAFSS